MEKTKIKNALDFYCFANNLKYASSFDANETMANHIYGSLILAIAMNSEFSITTDIGKVIRTIVLSYIEKIDPKKFFNIIMNLEKGPTYYNELYEKKQNYTKEAQFALKCQYLDKSLTKLLTENPSISLEEFYYLSVTSNTIRPTNSEEERQYKEILRFYQYNYTLKQKNRSGWDKNHWNIKTPHIERIAEHVFGTLVLALALDSEFDFKIAINEVLETLAVHEIGEILIGDITPFDNITPEEKANMEHQAISTILGNLKIKERVLKKLIEFDHQSNRNAEFALWCDKLEADIQSKIYQENNLQHPLDDNPNNIVLQYPAIKQMLAEGVETAFDIWYEWDKDKFSKSQILIKTLKYIKENRIMNEQVLF